MKILVPTDFSPLSKIAIQYAIGLSQDLELEMVILHVVNTNAPTMARIGSQKLGEAVKISTEQHMKEFMATIEKESASDLKIYSKVVYDSSIQKGVEAFALKNDIDIICMGTKGATGLKKTLFGSNAAAMITNSATPVLTIPEYAEYKGISTIVYSSDLDNLDDELTLLMPFGKLMEAWIHILHIDKDDKNVHKDLEEALRSSWSYDRIKTEILENDSIINGINQYVAEVDADMVAMFTHSSSLLDKLFHKSMTKKAVFQATTPLLTFQKA